MSLSKSLVHASAKVRRDVAKDISEALGIPLTRNLGKYLGMSSIYGRVTANTFEYLLNKMYSRLAGWKS